MKKKLIFLALVVSCMLTAKAQIVQTLTLDNGSVLYGYTKSQKPSIGWTFSAEKAIIVMSGNKAKNIQTKKVAYNNLSEEWKHYADENNLLNGKSELSLSTIDTGGIINDVLVMEQGRTVKYVELKHEYFLNRTNISMVEYASRDKMLLSGINHTFKMKDGSIITGQCIKEIPGEEVFLLMEDGMVQSVNKDDIVKDNFSKNNPNQSLFEQSKLIDEIRMKDGSMYSGIITEQNYEEKPYFFIITTKSGDVETTSSLRFEEVAEYGKLPNPDYAEVRDVQLNKGQVLVNGVDAEQVKLTEQQGAFIIRPEMKRVELKLEGSEMDVIIEANFKEEREKQDNYLIKTRKFTKDKKRTDLCYFSYKDIIESSVTASENETSVNNTTRMVYNVKAKGMYVFFNSGTKKAVLIDVQ